MDTNHHPQGGNVIPLLMDTKTVARLLSVSPRTLEDWRLTGQGPCFIKLASRMVRYRRRDLEEFMDRAIFSNTAQALAA